MRCQAWRNLAVLTIAAVLVSCAPLPTVQPLESGERAAVVRGEKTIVLMRHSVTRDGEPYRESDATRFGIANIDAGGLLSEDIPMRATSTEALEEGWLYTMLNPGTYYFVAYPPGMQQNPPAVAYHVASARYGRLANLGLKPRGDAFWYPAMQRFVVSGPRPNDFSAIPGFLLQVPEGAKVLYAGSLRLSCGTIPGIFGRLTDNCDAFEVEDETRRAGEISKAAFGETLPMTTRPLTRYGEASHALPKTVLDKVAIEFDAEAQSRTGVTGATPRPTFLLPGSGAGSVATARAFGVFNILSLLAQSAEIAAEEEEARERAEKWAPCFRKLQDGIDMAQVSAMARRTIADVLGRNGTGDRTQSAGAGRPPPAALRVTWLGSGFRECVERGTLCVEVAIRVRLRIQRESVPSYDTIHVYSSDYESDPLKTSYRLYLRRVPQQSICRPITAYCGESGSTYVQREIGNGIRHIASRIAADLSGR